jgi:hypothetical protein
MSDLQWELIIVGAILCYFIYRIEQRIEDQIKMLSNIGDMLDRLIKLSRGIEH